MGLIPARAGNTGARTHTHRRERAHPRSRGEHGFAVVFPAPGGGSSPLARGTHPYCHPARTRNGLIPARAGNTSRCGHSVRPGRAHPRSRGEHIDASELFVAQKGSSPLARGTPAGCPPGVQGGGVGGLIPARAGNTGVRFGVLMGAWAHPRSRGEHATGKGRSPWFWGSSPLARGTRVRPRPRYALPQSRAHPRSRGEHVVLVHGGSGDWGSSPLARGTHLMSQV